MIRGYKPNLNSAIMAWATPTVVFVVAKRIFDFKTIESFIEYKVAIFRIPTGQKLEMKPEGQRGWNTETIYSDIKLELKLDDIIIFDCNTSNRYRVVNKTDWSSFGFNEFEIVSDYKG